MYYVYSSSTVVVTYIYYNIYVFSFQFCTFVEVSTPLYNRILFYTVQRISLNVIFRPMIRISTKMSRRNCL